MDITTSNMEFSTVPHVPVFRSEKFRTPSPVEEKVGLWVDRIGAGAGERTWKGLRILGLYAAVFVTKGRGTFISRTAGAATVQAGDTMLLFPEEPAVYAADGSWQTLWVVWSGSDATRLETCGYLNPRRPVVRDRLNATQRAFNSLSPIMANEDLAAVLKRKSIILDQVADLYSASIRFRRPTDARMQSAVSFLTAHYAENLVIPDLAGRFNLSPTHFRRLFKEYAGRGPRGFITALRISRAKELLSKGLPIKKIATLTGYRDVFYFMRVFKVVVGTPPGKFAAVGR